MAQKLKQDDAGDKALLESLAAFHPIANIFPLLQGEEFDALVDDIARNGLAQPIIKYQGQILDGRNRYRACLKSRVTPIFAEFTGDDPVTFVISANLHRRHLTQAEKRDLIAKLLKDDPKRSNQATANLARSSDKTVASVRTELEAHSEIPSVDRTDTAGRKSPAKKPRKGGIKTSGNPEPMEAPETTAESASPGVVTSDGAVVPGDNGHERRALVLLTELAAHAEADPSTVAQGLSKALTSPHRTSLIGFLDAVRGRLIAVVH